MNYSYIDIDYELNESYAVLNTIQHSLNKFGMSPISCSGMTFSCDYIKKLLGVSPSDLIIIRLSSDYDKNIELKNL